MPMKVEYFIARKVALAGRQSFSNLIIRIAIAAIGLSVTVMIVATALITGFKNEISSKIFGFWGHIHIVNSQINRSFEAVPVSIDQDFYPSLDTIKRVKYLDDRKFLGMQIGEELVLNETNGGIRHIQTFAHMPGIIKTKKELEGIILKGVGKDFDWENMGNYLVEGTRIGMDEEEASRDIIISEQTSRRLRVKPGDQFIVHFVVEGEQLKRRFKVAGIYKTGLEEYDRKFAIVDIRQIQQLLGWSDREVGGFEVFIDNIDDLEPINQHIYIEEIPNDLYSQTIRGKFPSIFEWLELQNINEVVIISLMLIVSIINMVTALMILILERTNMIGVLKSLGQTDWSIRKIFLYYAAYIISLGLLFGNLFGIGICLLQEKFELIQLSEADYYLSVAPIELNFWAIIALNVGTLLVTILFLVIPSYLVTSITPVKAIRFK